MVKFGNLLYTLMPIGFIRVLGAYGNTLYTGIRGNIPSDFFMEHRNDKVICVTVENNELAIYIGESEENANGV